MTQIRQIKKTEISSVFLPEDLAKLVLEVAAGGVEVVQVGQDTALSGGTFSRVHTRFHHDAQPANNMIGTHVIRNTGKCFFSFCFEVSYKDL